MNDSELQSLGTFDLIWCTGVLYHNPEQSRFLRLLFDLLNIGGYLILESSVTRHKYLKDYNCVEILWPKTQAAAGIGTSDEVNIDSLVKNSEYQSLTNQSNVSHLPSKLAVISWVEMVGFKNIEMIDYNIEGRMVLMTQKTSFKGYAYINRGPEPSPYLIGKAN